MHFDDRLGTVLRMRANGDGTRRIQLRQLLDLLGTSPAEARGPRIDNAFTKLTELSATIPAHERAAMLREAALRLRSPRLVVALAAQEPSVATVAVQRAQLSPEQWLDLVPALPPGARPALRQRRDLAPEVLGLLARLGVTDRGLPPVAEAAAVSAAVVTEPEALPAQSEPLNGQGIGAIVRRIEAYRRSKQVGEHIAANDSPRLPLGEEHVLAVPAEVQACDFACDAEGRVTWCDSGVAPMLMGMRLLSGVQFSTVLRHRQPLRTLALQLDGAPAISGSWQIDASPWFDPLTGQFMGYRGRLRRPAIAAPQALANPPVPDSEADRIRQMLHELRTPVNAIQIGAEIIQQQLYGATPHEYRALAAGIAGDAARMLSAFEELERLARLDSGAQDLDLGETDLAKVIAATVGQLGAHTKGRGSGFALRIEDEPLPVPLAQLELERIVWRLLATLAGVSAPGEQLRLRLRHKAGAVRLDLALPAALAASEHDAIFRTAAGAIPQVISAGVFGIGFALRLARAEARAAGGDLIRKGDRLRLTLPGLTEADAPHTDAPGSAAGAA